MPIQRVPAGEVWKFLNKRVAPALLDAKESPDTVNTDFKSGLVGIMCGRMGAAKVSNTPYNATVVGAIPASFPGLAANPDRILVALNDGTIVDEAAFFAGDGSAWTGPTITIPGFYYQHNVVTKTGASPQTDDSAVLAIPINGATKVIATCPSGDFVSEGELQTWLQFDGGAWELANSCLVDSGGCGYGLIVTNDPDAIVTTGKTLLTGVRCKAIEAGQTVTVDGFVLIMGVKE